MNKKSIGSFISNLRKANGMTQVDLAERLNVSDKTISRWECDNGTPDIADISVIAEIFGVSCDELLRGERQSPEVRQGANEVNQIASPKAERQIKRLIDNSLSKYRTKTFISMGISLVGLIVAMIINTGFIRANIGFFASTIFYVMAFICQIIFINIAFNSISNADLDLEKIGQFKYDIIKGGKYSFAFTIFLFAFSLPLITMVNDTYLGLTFGTWIGYGLLYSILVVVSFLLIFSFVKVFLLKKNMIILEAKKEKKIYGNYKLKKKYIFIALILMSFIFLIHLIATSGFNVESFRQAIVFEDYDSFVEFMEKPVDENFIDQEYDLPENDPQYIEGVDEYGNVISEEALLQKLYINEGTEDEQVVCEFVLRNNSFYSYQYEEKKGSLLPIRVYTKDSYDEAYLYMTSINNRFVIAYLITPAILSILYFKKRII